MATLAILASEYAAPNAGMFDGSLAVCRTDAGPSVAARTRAFAVKEDAAYVSESEISYRNWRGVTIESAHAS